MAATHDAPVLYDLTDGVAQITLNRPDRLNAWNQALGAAFHDRLDEAEADPEVKVIVITGAGRGFCAGADMDLLQGVGSGGDGGSGSSGGELDRRDTRRLVEITKPIIAAVNGACAGLGFVYAIAADIRFAARGAKFTTAFAHRGLIAEYGSSWYLPKLVGQSVAVELERTIKTPKRYAAIMSAYLQAIKRGDYARVDYVCPSVDLAARLQRIIHGIKAIPVKKERVPLKAQHYRVFRFTDYEGWT